MFDFCHKPKLPAPFVIFNHLFNLVRAGIRSVYKQTHLNKKRGNHNKVANYFITKKPSQFELKLTKQHNENYVRWEGLVTDELVANQEKEAREDTKFILNANSEK